MTGVQTCALPILRIITCVTVVKVAGQAEGWERTYLIRPAVHSGAVTHVMILTGPPMRGDLRALFESSGETP